MVQRPGLPVHGGIVDEVTSWSAVLREPVAPLSPVEAADPARCAQRPAAADGAPPPLRLVHDEP